MQPRLEVADVFRDGASQFLRQYGRHHSANQHRTLGAVIHCRTAQLGGKSQHCPDCGHQRIQYHSCRNRHCPKCQGMARAAWVDQRETELLPVPYFHVVFTLPQQLAPLALQNKRVMYGILFRAAAETIQQLALDPKHLGARVGILMVLHTWGQNLMHHPHVHSVVTGGGISPDGSRWVACRRTAGERKPFLIDVRILSRVFRGKFISLLKRAYKRGGLKFHGQLSELAQPAAFERRIDASVQRDWVVYAKRPFGGPQQVLRYLARYTHRVAISDQRLLELKDGQVRFQYKDYADGQRTKPMTLYSSEFIRRFLMHTLPSRFVRIRYFGFLANRFRKQRLEQCRSLLGTRSAESASSPVAADQFAGNLDKPKATSKCPVCDCGRLLIVDVPAISTGLPSRHLLSGPHFASGSLARSGRSPPHR